MHERSLGQFFWYFKHGFCWLLQNAFWFMNKHWDCKSWQIFSNHIFEYFPDLARLYLNITGAWNCYSQLITIRWNNMVKILKFFKLRVYLGNSKRLVILLNHLTFNYCLKLLWNHKLNFILNLNVIFFYHQGFIFFVLCIFIGKVRIDSNGLISGTILNLKIFKFIFLDQF